MTRSPMARIAGLDGLRAVAVTGVLLYHGGLAAVPGGFLGVDLFFAVSGFLITTLLLREAAGTGRIDVVAFWGRRVRRLLPALTLVTVATVLTVALVPSVGGSLDLRGDALAALFYVANWHFMASGAGYFEQLAAPSPLLHTWSLAIEEQFYLVWPILLLLALRRRTPRWAMTATVTVAALASACWMVALVESRASTDRLYYGTDTRAQTILAGVAAALVLDRRGASAAAGLRRASWRPALAGVVGLAALGGVVVAMSMVAERDALLYRGGLSLYAVVAAVLVAAVAASPCSAVTRALDLRPLRYLGVVSYGLYLWHWPVFLLLTSGGTSLAGTSLLALRLVVTLMLAIASLHLVETPLRRAAWRLPRRLALPAGAVAMACGLLLVAPRALPSTAPGQLGAGPAGRAGASAVSDHPTPDREPEPRMLRRRSLPPPTRLDESRALRVTVLGDSTARTLAEGFLDVPGKGGVTFRNAAVLGCGIAYGSPYLYMGELDPYRRGRCADWAARWRRVVASRPTDVVAVMVGRWEVVDQVVDGIWTHVGEPRFDRYLRRELETAVAVATSTGAEVAFLTAPYCDRGEQPDGSGWPEDDPVRVDAFNDVLRSVAERHPGTAHVIELGRRTSDREHHYVAEVDGVVLRYDGVHFTAAAARWLQPWLVRELARTTRD